MSFFGQGLDPRFVNSMQLITGALPAEYGLRVAGIVDMQTKSGLFQPGGSVEMRGGSYGTIKPSVAIWRIGRRLQLFRLRRQSPDRITASTPSTPAYNQIHDDTMQTHGFAYLDKIIDSSSKVAFIAGTFHGQFQIPNNPGQTPLFAAGRLRADHRRHRLQFRTLSEHQVESSAFGALSYLRAEEDFDFQVSAFSKYSTLHYHPDALGDIFFNGIAAERAAAELRQRRAGRRQLQLGADHTLRAGLYLQGERASADTNSSVLPITASRRRRCRRSGLPRHGRCDLWQRRRRRSSRTRPRPAGPTAPISRTNGGSRRSSRSITARRFDEVNEYTMDNQLSPRVNAVWKPTDATTVHAGYANYFTPPPFELVATSRSLDRRHELELRVARPRRRPAPAPASIRRSRPSARSMFDVGATQEVMPGLKVGIDVYYKYARNLLDEGQFGAPVILTPFNYHVGYNKGVELTTAYDHGKFSYYGNLADRRREGRGHQLGAVQFRSIAGNGCPNPISPMPTRISSTPTTASS